LSLYLETAKTSADLYLQIGVHSTGIFYRNLLHQPDGTYAPDYTHNFAEEERLYQSLISLTELTGDPKYYEAAKRAVDAIFNYEPGATGLLPMGDASGFNLQTFTPIGNCGFTENSVPITPIYNLASDKSKIMKMLDAYYTYFGLRTTPTGSVDINTGKATWGGETVAMQIEILCEAYGLTGNSKYLDAAKNLLNYLKTKQGATGIISWSKDAEGNRWFWVNYAWEYGRMFGNILKWTQDAYVLEFARQHIDGLITYGWNIDGTHHWCGRINVDTGYADPAYAKMPPFAEYYQDIGLVELYKLTGDTRYIEILKLNVPTDYTDFVFPTHNVPEAIIRNLDIYQLTGERLDAAKTIANRLRNWIIANNYYIWGGLEEDYPIITIDNFWHSVLALLLVAQSELTLKLTLKSLPINVSFTLDNKPYGVTPTTIAVSPGTHIIGVPSEVEA
jgi:hypothetical protein